MPKQVSETGKTNTQNTGHEQSEAPAVADRLVKQGSTEPLAPSAPSDGNAPLNFPTPKHRVG